VFRLRNAAVEDRSVTIRNQTVVTPGAATLLKSMLAPRGSSRAITGQGSILDAISNQSSTPQGTTPSAGGGGTGANIAQRTNSSVGSGGGSGVKVEGDVRTNSIVIYDLAKRRAYYQRLIDSIDVAQNLVEIEACVVDVNRDQMSELGFGLDASRGNARLVVDPTSTLAAPLAGSSSLIVASLDRFFGRLSAMEREGQAHVIAKPSVLTLENLVAVLDLSQTVYIRATGERVASIEAVTAGMLLRVTPRVVRDKQSTQVHLTVDIEDGKVLPAQAGTDGTPEVQRSTISTQAVLLDRQSLIIGGYDTSSSSNADNGVPVVSKIPLIGALFSGTSKISQSRQRLFILTPRLVRPEATKRTS
jgi:type III secretion protein C